MQTVREPAVAGMFYYLDKKLLKMQLGKLFSGIKATKKYKMVVSPHAGYEYSGRTAAFAVSSLKPGKTFIVLGPNHRGFGSQFATMGTGAWKTPLKRVKINKEIAGELMKWGLLHDDPIAHEQEHSIEVQLPLLQHRFKDFSFVPICIMNTGYDRDFLEKCKSLAKAIAKIMKKRSVRVIASSDFTHYMPIDIANEKDGAAMDEILNLDVAGFFETLHEQGASVCGFGPIAVVMAIAKELGMKPKLITKSSSGDVSGDYGSVVTYYAIGFG